LKKNEVNTVNSSSGIENKKMCTSFMFDEIVVVLVVIVKMVDAKTDVGELNFPIFKIINSLTP